jgi:regulator of sigma E protease
LDPHVNPADPTPTPPRPHDVAQPGPIDPATGQPDHGAEVTELKSWFRENAVSLVCTVGALAAVGYWLDPIDALKVAVGLGFIIFIHELGHFAAAKWCDVHVRTFSIGFGPAVPFCSYKWGETTYMIGVVPLGGYVAMVGEGEGAEGEEEGEEDPRSFRKKTVGQRMFIISAGVVMNVLLGLACFVAAYLHGVQEKPATVDNIESGGAAWREGMRTGDHITRLGGRDNPPFDDIRPQVMSSDEGEQIPIAWDRPEPDGGVRHFAGAVTPIRAEGQKFPQIGVGPPAALTLISGNKLKVQPCVPGSPAAAATSADGTEKFEAGDRVVKMTDPGDPKRPLTAVTGYADYYQRMVRLAHEPVAFEVRRKGSDATATIVVKPAFRHDLGMRMKMGKVAAVRKGGAAEKAGVVTNPEPQTAGGDSIKAVLLPPDERGKRVWYVDGLDPTKPDDGLDWGRPEFQVPGVAADVLKGQVEKRPLDPVLLPQQLNDWAKDRSGPLALDVVVKREGGPSVETVRLPLAFDPSFRFDRETVNQPNSPMPLSGLGLAYWVDAQIDEVSPDGPAAKAATAPGELRTGLWHGFKRLVGLEDRTAAPGGEPRPLQRNDVVVAVRFKAADADGSLKAGEWKDDLKAHQWASADWVYQTYAPEIDLRVRRGGGDEVIGVTLKGVESKWPLDDRGLVFQTEVQVQKAADVGDAIRLGALRTVRFIKTVYMNLYGYINGRISVKTLSGPLTIANVSYKLAGEDLWQFLLFLGMISVNLAVVNFLPIPVLDGGHMVFLILEKIMGRPVPERVSAVLMYTGLFMILSLMAYVLVRDADRLFFGGF